MIELSEYYRELKVFAECGMNVSKAAKKLIFHRNTVVYHFEVVKKKTGKDPYNFFDLLDLLRDGLVTHCKDCIYFESAIVNKRGFLICPATGMDITNNDFCSYAERKTDE